MSRNSHLFSIIVLCLSPGIGQRLERPELLFGDFGGMGPDLYFWDDSTGDHENCSQTK